jgi:hypothetical protein
VVQDSRARYRAFRFLCSHLVRVDNRQLDSFGSNKLRLHVREGSLPKVWHKLRMERSLAHENLNHLTEWMPISGPKYFEK